MTQKKNEDNLLKFRAGNAKLDSSIYTFSLPSGYTCPGALDCLARADVQTGKIKDGPHQKFRCFSATDETRPSVRKARWHNFYMLTACADAAEMTSLIEKSIPEPARIIRVHVGGDFFSQTYFDAWLSVAERNPHITCYAYTKSIHFVKERWDRVCAAKNFCLTSSEGGRFDHYAEELGMIQAHVVHHPDEAAALNLEIDHDDSHAIANEKSFALLLHGTQPKDTAAAAALQRLKNENIKFSYARPTKLQDAEAQNVDN
jgi:hypothetical protein